MQGEKEIWKDVIGYEGIYMISDLGRVKSFKCNRERILNPSKKSYGYSSAGLSKEGCVKTYYVHKLVAMAFLNHIPEDRKLVINHKDNNPLNNRLDNLEITTQRYNSSCHKTGGTSEYIGVFWEKHRGNWRAGIIFNGKNKRLGSFKSEKEAAKYYQDALKSIENGTEIKVKKVKYSSKYTGVYWKKASSKWVASLCINGGKKHIGYFKIEQEAHEARLKYINDNNLKQ